MRRPQGQTIKLIDAALIAASVACISYFHYSTVHVDFMSHASLHILLRRLYYIPIIYAALRFGLRGGLLTSLTVTVFFTPHAISSMGGLFETGSIDNLFDIILYNVVALTTGLVVDSRRRQKQRYDEIVELNREVEDRESDLRQIKSYIESIINSVSNAVISVDRSRRIVTVNPAACRLLGNRDDELVAFPVDHVFAGHDDILRAVGLVLSGDQERVTLEVAMASPDGGDLDVVARITPHLSSGDPVGIIISLEDMTEVNQLTSQLLRADRLSGLGELVTGVAHEVRNPLGVIRASVQMLESEPGNGEAPAEFRQVMLQEIDRLDAFVNTLLDFGRPSESQMGPVDACRVLEDVVLLTKPYARQQQVEFNGSPAGDPCEIWADEGRIRQVFINLISNAVQSMPQGGVLGIGLAGDDGYLRVSFSDTGDGIPDSIRERIFDPFVTTRPQGSGLGLSIVHRIVDAHRGYIEIESNEGEGTTFTVGLPLARKEERIERGSDG